jgi:hypothetical protein
MQGISVDFICSLNTPFLDLYMVQWNVLFLEGEVVAM